MLLGCTMFTLQFLGCTMFTLQCNCFSHCMECCSIRPYYLTKLNTNYGNARCPRIFLRLPILRVAVLCVPRCGAQIADTRRIGSLRTMRGHPNYAVYTRPCLLLLVLIQTIPSATVCTNVVLHSNTAVNCVCNGHFNCLELYTFTSYSFV